jgi:isoleucyl-tRNA synthetase
VATYGKAPFKGIMSCGFIVDGDGYKMSKSRGNSMDPAEVIEQYGADVLRLWVGSIDYSQDVGIDDEIIQRTSEAYRRIRNNFRFLLSNLYDFDWQTDTVTWEQLSGIDRWAMVRLQQLMTTVTEAYESFKFHVAYHAIYDYIVTDLSAVYLDALKDRLYSDAPKSAQRRSAQTVLMHVLEVLVRQLAPMLSFTCDEVWEFYPEGMREPGRVAAIQLAGWPEDADFSPAIPEAAARQIKQDYGVVLAVRELITKQLEEARSEKIIGKSQEAKVVVTAPAAIIDVLQAQGLPTLEELFIVAKVELIIAQAAGEPQVTVSKSAGDKCPRCWNIRELGGNAEHPDLCQRCASVLAES